MKCRELKPVLGAALVIALAVALAIVLGRVNRTEPPTLLDPSALDTDAEVVGGPVPGIGWCFGLLVGDSRGDTVVLVGGVRSAKRLQRSPDLPGSRPVCS